jgi:catechol 2,3-dioxygenase-like lactoylglutathione lyase family enzyme
MAAARLEHVNFTVRNAQETAQMLCDLFDWHIRWHGPALNGGTTYHVGTDDAYVAIFTPKGRAVVRDEDKAAKGNMNHVGVVVDDLDAVESAVKARGLVPYNHADYEPGRRFYFNDTDGIEYEVVSYR